MICRTSKPGKMTLTEARTRLLTKITGFVFFIFYRGTVFKFNILSINFILPFLILPISLLYPFTFVSS